MHGLIEIHTGSEIMGNIYYRKISVNFPKFPPNTKFPENFYNNKFTCTVPGDVEVYIADSTSVVSLTRPSSTHPTVG